jgi:hypothetical protein
VRKLERQIVCNAVAGPLPIHCYIGAAALVTPTQEEASSRGEQPAASSLKYLQAALQGSGEIPSPQYLCKYFTKGGSIDRGMVGVKHPSGDSSTVGAQPGGSGGDGGGVMTRRPCRPAGFFLIITRLGKECAGQL